jgi:hypothetical protein
MQTSTYKASVLNSEQEPANNPFHSFLLRQALMRDHVQTAISQLIRNYEATSGSSVVRLNFHAEKRSVSLDAIPNLRDSSLRGA